MAGFLVYRLGDRALAEDVVADTFERVMTAKRGWQRGREENAAGDGAQGGTAQGTTKGDGR